MFYKCGVFLFLGNIIVGCVITMVVVYVVVVKGGVCSLCGCQLLKLLFIYVVSC